jgi:hypothetical protein
MQFSPSQWGGGVLQVDDLEWDSMERTTIMFADSRTISRRRLETGDIHPTKPEHSRAIVGDAGCPQELAAGSDSDWLRSAMVAQFSLCTQLAAELNAQNRGHFMTARATHFQESTAASRYLNETISELEKNPSPYDTVEVLSARDVAHCGDRTSAYAYTYAMGDYDASNGVAVLIQKGSIVYEFEVEGTEAPEMTAVNAAIEDLFNCVQEGSETKTGPIFLRH